MTKNLRYNKKIQEETDAFQKMITTYTAKLKKEYEKELLHSHIILLEKIAEGENLNIIELKEKYLKKKTKKSTEKSTKKSTEKSTETLLVKIKFKGTTYYHENKDEGNVYNEDSIIVGSFQNGEIKLNSKISNKT